METNAAIGIGAFRAILKITFYRTADSRQLATYLMMPPCLQIDLKKSIVLAFSERLVR